MNYDDAYIWEHQTFKKYNELNKYIDEIKPVLIGEKIKAIFASGEFNGTYCNHHNFLKKIEHPNIDSYNFGPVIIKIGEHNLFLYTWSGSYIDISLDTNFEILNTELIQYCECSFIFADNIMGKKISDIYLTRADSDLDFGIDFIADDCISNDMFRHLVIKMENDYRLLFHVCFDFWGITQSKNDDFECSN